jgi:outer membrane receptor for ferrienterochelin and colicin
MRMYLTRRIILLMVFLVAFLCRPLASQQEEYITEETSKILNFEDFNVEDTDNLQTVYLTSLKSRVSLKFENSHLVDLLDAVSKHTGISFVYEDELVNISGISIDVDNEELYTLLDNVLSPHNISYFEFEYSKVALAKRRKVEEKTGAIQGIVKDESGERLIGANVLVKELGIGCAADSRGFYFIKNIKPGRYILEISYVGYEKETRKIVVKAGEILDLNFTLRSTSFQIGGIEVIGHTDLLPKDVSTKTYISSGEIEHYQASSLKDVLDLVPGVQKTDNPGLSKTSQITVRGSESDQMSTFGTLIIVDGTPISNNANLQFERLTGGLFGNTNRGAGVDLRTIPADNIESIEVITGLPSVRYGDVTAGVINVQTKIGASPNRLKIKNNPNTMEGNLGGGFLLGEDGLSYNLNIAQSERDIRKEGDEYTRLTGQAVYSSNLFDNQLNMNNKFNFQTVYDEEKPKGDAMKTHNYNRGFSLGYSQWGKYKPREGVSAFDYNMYVNMRRENTMKSRMIQSDLRILPSGDTISTYLGRVETKGIEWTAGGRLEWNRVFYTGDIIHKFLIGTDPQYNANTGEGVLFDTLLNYYGATSGRRPYSFSDIPGQLLMNIYAEDKLTGHFLFDFNLMLGLRYEMYRPYKINLSGLWGDGDLVESHQGTYFNPRVNLMVYLSDYNQFRLSVGTTSKSPSMDKIYPPESVFRWRNPFDSTISYFTYDRRNPDLKGYRESQYEAAFDQKISNLMGASVSAYYKKRNNETREWYYPVFNYYNYNNTDYLYYLDTYTIARNSGVTYSRGVEFTLRTSRIKSLNMEFQVVGSYNYLKFLPNVMRYDDTPEEAKGQYHTYYVPGIPIDTAYGMSYQSNEKWEDQVQMNYYIKYTHPQLGLWVTLRAEHLVMVRTRNLDFQYQNFDILSETQQMSYLFDRSVKIQPNKWLFNMNISKSLFRGAEVSFYVNNFLDDSAVWLYWFNPTQMREGIRNPSLTYGIEFSMIIDDFFRSNK